MVKRFVDLILTAPSLVLLLPVAALIAILVRLTSRGPALYWSDRVGRDGKIFSMPKFRTMKIGTPAIASHLLQDARANLSPIGGFLRRTSLDEVPQLWSVLIGQMSLVGPRPALFNQDDLIALRRKTGVDTLRPGVTGWAQINGRDELSIPQKVALDQEYLERQSLALDLRIIFRTIRKMMGDSSVAH